MKQQEPAATELTVRPHPARKGWQVARLIYDSRNPDHLRQIDAALAAWRAEEAMQDANAAIQKGN